MQQLKDRATAPVTACGVPAVSSSGGIFCREPDPESGFLSDPAPQ
ncbi:MAG: N-acetyl-alpha-D-glucosaminyl L-malate synthase BshA [Bacteroidales bacterium]|nr:N-acetyl-alpha-D-glucosaminyl L-malate synthase BshA [Bacteroidales bacterium]